MATDLKKILKAKEKNFDKENQERISRCLPVAQKIVEMVAEEKLPMGILTDKKGLLKEDVANKYDDFAIKILVLMLESDIKYSERNFLFQLIYQLFEQTKEKVINSIDRSFSRANQEKWGKDELDIGMKDIHEILINIKTE